jgi:hypothetical protein
MKTEKGIEIQRQSVKQYWASMTKEQRSAEMHRRQMVAQRKRMASLSRSSNIISSSESPFPQESGGSIKQRIEALETALAALRAELGF